MSYSLNPAKTEYAVLIDYVLQVAEGTPNLGEHVACMENPLAAQRDDGKCFKLDVQPN